jgi:predicted alpha/beta-fold hydrolase
LDSKPRNKKLIIFVHGLTGHKNEHIFYNTAKFFSQNNFATFRFDLYSGEKKGRLLSKCTIKIHVFDLKTVINYFRKKYSKIYLVGHSLGGPVVLMAGLKNTIESIVLWDPSLNTLEGLSSNILKFNKQLNKYILKWGTEYLLSKEMVKSWKKTDDKLLQYFQVPTKIICAGKGILYKKWKTKVPLIKTKHKFSVIKKLGIVLMKKKQ